jgi:hypothetical protein
VTISLFTSREDHSGNSFSVFSGPGYPVNWLGSCFIRAYARTNAKATGPKPVGEKSRRRWRSEGAKCFETGYQQFAETFALYRSGPVPEISAAQRTIGFQALRLSQGKIALLKKSQSLETILSGLFCCDRTKNSQLSCGDFITIIETEHFQCPVAEITCLSLRSKWAVGKARGAEHPAPVLISS